MKKIFILANFVLLLSACDGDKQNTSTTANTHDAAKPTEIAQHLQPQSDSAKIASHHEESTTKTQPEKLQQESDVAKAQTAMPIAQSQEKSDAATTSSDKNNLSSTEKVKSKEQKIKSPSTKEKKHQVKNKPTTPATKPKKARENVKGLSEEELRVGAQQPLSIDHINHLKSQCRYPFMSDKEMKIYRCFPVKVKQ